MHLLNWVHVRNAYVRVPVFWFHSYRGKIIFFFWIISMDRCNAVCMTVLQQQPRRTTLIKHACLEKKEMMHGIQMSTWTLMVNKCKASQWDDIFNMQIENKTHRLHNRKMLLSKICVGNTVFSGVQSKQFADIGKRKLRRYALFNIKLKVNIFLFYLWSVDKYATTAVISKYVLIIYTEGSINSKPTSQHSYVRCLSA